MSAETRFIDAIHADPHDPRVLEDLLLGSKRIIHEYVKYIDGSVENMLDDKGNDYEGINFMDFRAALVELHHDNPTNPHVLYLMGRLNMAMKQPEDVYLPLIDEAIHHGSPEAMYFRAQRYTDPQYGTPDLNAARDLFNMAASKGHYLAIKELENDKIEMPAEGRDALKAVDEFIREVYSQPRYLKKDAKPILESVQNFHKDAVKLCKQVCAETPKRPDQSQKEYNKLIGDKLVVLAKNSFPHRNNQILSFLADLVFIPLGTLLLGNPFRIKKATTGSSTFFSFNTKRVNMLADSLKEVFDKSETLEAKAQKDAENEPKDDKLDRPSL